MARLFAARDWAACSAYYPRVADKRDDPSLLRFLTERLDEEAGAIIENTPLFFAQEPKESFVDRYVGRGALLERNRADQELVAVTVEVMQRVQGPAPIPVPTGPPDETTVLGTAVLKLLAARFDWHPDYRENWRPERTK